LKPASSCKPLPSSLKPPKQSDSYLKKIKGKLPLFATL
jgi:hypothetical protein